jgi:predicted ATPase
VPLLEREAQLASLGEYAGQARQGDGRLVLIAGEAGVGKSALVEQVRHGLTDATWCWGACDGLFTPRPLGPLVDIADALGGELLELCRTDAPRDELFSALLRQVRAPGELHVLVVENVHWADDATIDLLRFLSRRIQDVPVLLLVTYRDEGLTATDPLRIALGDLATQRPVRRISLPPLSADAVALLTSGSGLDPAALYRLTGGNPFYVGQAVQAGRHGAGHTNAEIAGKLFISVKTVGHHVSAVLAKLDAPTRRAAAARAAKLGLAGTFG